MVDLFAMVGELVAEVVFDVLPEVICQSLRPSPRISGIETCPIVPRPSASAGEQRPTV